MGFMDHVRSCNRHQMEQFIPFRIDGTVVGCMRPAFARELRDWPEVFSVTHGQVDLAVPSTGLEERSSAVARVLRELLQRGVLNHLLGEQYGVTSRERPGCLLLMDRAAAPWFGIRAFGQHLNGYVMLDGECHMWIARRAADRMIFPSKLDHLVAGGLPHGVGLLENLQKECREEAAIDPELAARATPVGTVSYLAESAAGLKPDILYCYDLELPAEFRPHCTDGEVEEFYLWPVSRVLETVRDSQEFKQNCNLVIIDFLIRHGYIPPEHPEYHDLISGLHPALPY